MKRTKKERHDVKFMMNSLKEVFNANGGWYLCSLNWLVRKNQFVTDVCWNLKLKIGEIICAY
jgi:hypothetical protein